MRIFSHSHRTFAIFLALALAVCLAACQPAAAQEQPRRGGTLIVALDGDPPGLNPGITTAIPTQLVGGQVYSALIRLDHDLKVQPELAEKWDIAKDGMTYTFNLRKDVKWHDGKPFTAADVKHSMEETTGKYNGIARQALEAVGSIETPDPHTLVFKMKYASPPFFPWSLSIANHMHILPKHLYEGTDPTKNE
jgi:peptide/nickel transport system substrate-binding protein